MSRRRAAIAVATSLIAAGVIPLGLSLANAEAACPVWTDAKGDSTPEDIPAKQNDPDLDILGTAWTTTATDVVVKIKVDKLGTNGSYAPGRDWFLDFSMGGKAYYFWTSRIGTNTAGLVIDGVYDSADTKVASTTAAFDTTASVIAITLKKSALAAIATATVSGFTTRTAAEYGAVTEGWDASAAPAGTSFNMAEGTCAFAGFTGAPAPTGSGAPSGTPSGTPSAAPSGTPSATPSGTPAPTPTGTPGAFEEAPYSFPRAGCQLLTDAAGDGTAVVAGPAFGNDNDLDVTSVAVKTTATQIQVLAKIATLGDKPANPQNGDRFEVTFKLGGKTFAFGAGRQDQVATGASAPSANRNTVNGTADTKLKLTPTFDKTKNTVILAIDRAALETVAGVPAPVGTALTSFAVKTYGYFGNRENAADTAQATAAADQVYNVGDNLCFFPPAAKMEWLGEDTVTAQYGDLVEAAVALSADDDTPLEGRAVTFTLGTATVTGTTDADGVADVFLPALVAAGAATVTPTVTAAFAGDADNYKTALGYPVTVRSEATKLTLTVTKAGTARTVTATLVDDDKPRANAIAGQTLTVLVNGKKVGTVKTDAKGRAVWKTAKIGQTVKFTLAAVAGKYATASAQQKLA